MPIEKIAYGSEAKSDKINEIIDKVNTDQTELGKKCKVCSLDPKDTSDAPVVGTSEDASRCDHVHRAVGNDTPKDCSNAGSAGTAKLASRQDHVHKAVGSDAPKDTSDTAAVGTGTLASRQDHVHRAVGSDDPKDVADAPDVGTEKLASRQDHRHRGVRKIIAGDYITIDPPSGYGDVTVTGQPPGGLIKVEKTFSGSYLDGDEIVSDTPAVTKMLTAVYWELTTTDGNLIVDLYYNDVLITWGDGLGAAGDYGWADLLAFQQCHSNNLPYRGTIRQTPWNLGNKISVKALHDGTGSGKLVIYYATIT